MFDQLIARLGLSLLIGLLVGLERGWRQRDAPEGSRTAGIRTYGLAGLLGGVFAAISQAMHSPIVFAAGFLGFAGAFAWFKWREEVRDSTFSVTGVVAAMAVFGLGGLAVAGDQRIAAAGGVALAGVLASREALHNLLRRTSWVELRAVLLLAGMTAIVLPFLPDRTVDPWGGVNPAQIWLFTVLTACISYGGYIAMRVLGTSRGILVSALAGALISSTAVTIAFARRAAAGEQALPLAGGASLAAMVSLLRVTTLVALVKPFVALPLALPALAGAAIFAAAGAILLRHPVRTTGAEPKLGNPFDLGPLLLFAGSFAVVAAITAWLTQRFGAEGIVLAAGLSGIADVDVAALTTVRMIGEAVAVPTAVSAILLAVALNGGMRLVAALFVGPVRYAIPLCIASAAALAGGTAAYFLLLRAS